MIQPIHLRVLGDLLVLVFSGCVVFAVVALLVRTGIEWRTLKKWGRK